MFTTYDSTAVASNDDEDESVWNRYEIGTGKPCVYTGLSGCRTGRICYLVPNGPTYEGDPMWNRTVPV